LQHLTISDQHLNHKIYLEDNPDLEKINSYRQVLNRIWSLLHYWGSCV